MAARAPPGSTCCPCPSQFAPKAVQTRPLCRSKFCFQRAGNVTPAGRGKRSGAEAPAERAAGALAPPDRPARCWPARVRAGGPRGGPRGPLRGPIGGVHVPEPGAQDDTPVHIRRRFEDIGGTFAAHSAAGEGLGPSRPSTGHEDRPAGLWEARGQLRRDGQAALPRRLVARWHSGPVPLRPTTGFCQRSRTARPGPRSASRPISEPTWRSTGRRYRFGARTPAVQ